MKIGMCRSALLVAAGAVVVAGCGGGDDEDNGVADLDADGILSEMQDAAGEAESLRLSGAVSDSGSEVSVSMEMTADGSTGTLTAEGMTFELLSVGDKVYMKADEETWTSMAGDPAAGSLLADRYVLVPPDQAGFESFREFGDLAAFNDATLAPDGSVTKGDESEIDGEQVIGLVSSEGGTLQVATTGDPLPVRLDPPDGQTGGLEFEWDVSVEIEEPDEGDVVDLSSVM